MPRSSRTTPKPTGLLESNVNFNGDEDLPENEVPSPAGKLKSLKKSKKVPGSARAKLKAYGWSISSLAPSKDESPDIDFHRMLKGLGASFRNAAVEMKAKQTLLVSAVR